MKGNVEYPYRSIVCFDDSTYILDQSRPSVTASSSWYFDEEGSPGFPTRCEADVTGIQYFTWQGPGAPTDFYSTVTVNVTGSASGVAGAEAVSSATKVPDGVDGYAYTGFEPPTYDETATRIHHWIIIDATTVPSDADLYAYSSAGNGQYGASATSRALAEHSDPRDSP